MIDANLRFLTTILNLRSIEVCLELNLTDGVKFHERLVNKIIPVEMDLASSYISMAVFKEKQYQVCVPLLGINNQEIHSLSILNY